MAARLAIGMARQYAMITAAAAPAVPVSPWRVLNRNKKQNRRPFLRQDERDAAAAKSHLAYNYFPAA